MAYRNRGARLRIHQMKLNLNPEEKRLLDAVCDYTGEQPAVLARELLLAHAAEVLGMNDMPQLQLVGTANS